MARSTLATFVASKDRDELESIQRGGCISGACHGAIYYGETTELYNAHTEEIWDLLEARRADLGHATILEFINSLNGSKDVGSDAQFKNLLVWFAIEENVNMVLGE